LKPMDDKSKAARAKALNAEADRPCTLKSRLLKVIGAAEADETDAALDRIWSQGSFEVRRAPRIGMVMVTACDCFDTPFHLGEVLVSEAEVALDGHRGFGMVIGDVPEQALLAAAVEAAEAAGQYPALESILDFIGRLEAIDAEGKMQTAKLVGATQVHFASMKKENVDFGSLGES
jgi:alpha-D-ribose 1-methylphosphonate 5-triphosphate synthase subunit PhnG